MPNQEIYLRGDQIATYGSVNSSGNSNGVRVTLNGVTPLGGTNDVFRVVVRQVNSGQGVFNNGQFVDIYRWPDTVPPSPPLYSNLNPQHDQFQGRASSAEHQIFTSPARIVFQTDPITPGTVQYGPGFNPPRSEQLPFNAFPTTPPAIPCFVAGTRIATARGEIAVESVHPGDLVQTCDNGWQPVIWTGARKVCGLAALAPIRVETGTMGNSRPLLVSPQHRLLVTGAPSQLTCGEPELFAAAAHLINGHSIRRVRRPVVSYVHLLCEDHQVLLAEGAASESLFPGACALSAFDLAARDEINHLFPQLCVRYGRGGGLARPVMPRMAARLAFA